MKKQQDVALKKILLAKIWFYELFYYKIRELLKKTEQYPL